MKNNGIIASKMQIHAFMFRQPKSKYLNLFKGNSDRVIWFSDSFLCRYFGMNLNKSDTNASETCEIIQAIF